MTTSKTPRVTYTDDRSGTKHAERVRPRGARAQLPPAAQFVGEHEGGDRTDQCETGRERKEQMEEVVEGQLRYDHRADRIDDGRKIAWVGIAQKIIDTFDQRIFEIRNP